MRRLLLTMALVLLPVSAWAQSPIISGNLTGTTCPGAACLTLSVNGMGAASVQLAGTFSGTVQFESTVDGITYSALLMTKATDASTATSSTGVGVWSAWVGGQSIVRARVSSYASGTVRVTIGGALGLAAPGLSGVILGNGVQPATAVALPNDATQFFDGTGAFSVPPDTGLINAFTSAPVSGQTTITASGATALTFVAGSNVTLTTNNTTKALTIAASGGGGVPSGWTWISSSLSGSDGSTLDPILDSLFNIQVVGGGTGIISKYYVADAFVGPVVNYYVSGGTPAAKTAPSSNQQMMNQLGWAWNGTEWSQSASLSLVVNGAPTANGAVPSYIGAAWNSAANSGFAQAFYIWYQADNLPGLYLYNGDTGDYAQLKLTGAAEWSARNGGDDDFADWKARAGTFSGVVTGAGLAISGLTTPANKPVCFDASGNLYAGSNTTGVLSCP